jgi:aminoglycoside phosphotransferase (APT) family kinase protein
VRGLIPVPEVLEVRRADEAAGSPALVVTSYLPGERGDLLLPRLAEDQRARLGQTLGRLVADLGGMPMPRAGAFVDAELRLGPLPGPDGLVDWVGQHLPQLAGWTAEERAGLAVVAETAQAILDGVGRVCLVHGDLNPKNLLVDQDTLTLTGVVDWEFAHAGHPATDLGNLLRFERDPLFEAAVLEAYCERRGTEPEATLDLARAADLWALVELGTRAGGNPVADAAHDLLRAIARTRDPHALP